MQILSYVHTNNSLLQSMKDKWQTCLLVREGPPQGQNSNCQTGTNVWSWAPGGAQQKTHWPTDPWGSTTRHTAWPTISQSRRDFDFELGVSGSQWGLLSVPSGFAAKQAVSAVLLAAQQQVNCKSSRPATTGTAELHRPCTGHKGWDHLRG
jgi:hypothetical protein